MSDDLSSRVRVGVADGDALAESDLVPYPTDSETKFRIVTLFSEPACLVAQEDWYKGHESEWVFFIHTLMIVQGGRAKMEYWNPPGWDEHGEIEVGEGMVFLCPRGARMKWTVVSEEPFRRIVVDFPNPGFEFQTGASLV